MLWRLIDFFRSFRFQFSVSFWFSSFSFFSFLPGNSANTSSRIVYSPKSDANAIAWHQSIRILYPVNQFQLSSTLNKRLSG